jgi:hypothetical protein
MSKTFLSKYCNPIKRGDEFEKLTVIEFVDYHDNKAYWLCECIKI